MPEWNRVQISQFNIILYNKGIMDALDLLQSLIFPTYFKGIITYQKISNRGYYNIILYPKLIQEKDSLMLPVLELSLARL